MIAAAAALLLALPLAAAGSAPVRMSERERAIHVLDRLGYGARQGEVDRVLKEGVDAWVARQLRPETIDDSALDKRLSALPILRLSGRELYAAYPDDRTSTDGTKPADVADAMAAAKVLRAVESERQLQEVMTDFWFNHFNVSADKDQDRWLVSPYERETIRPRVFGRFRDLLGATAHSPAMLAYLDNFRSTIDSRYAPASSREAISAMEKKVAVDSMRGDRVKLGLTENYSRELLELHTLGVDGGYTQKDVVELARILTGWSMVLPRPRNRSEAFEFRFKAQRHDPGPKVFLGQDFPGSGEDEGERALDLLARRPETAKFIATKLCRRFVSDDPPADMVERVAARFRESDGDIRRTLEALFSDPAFYERRFFRAKVKTPLEFTASALRASGASLRDPFRVAQGIADMGQPLYRCDAPTGWPDDARAWINSGAILARTRAAADLFAGRRDSPAGADAKALLVATAARGPASEVSAFTDAFLGGVIGERARVAITARLGASSPPEAAAAFVLGSPDFQRK
ncbi:MAG TPA: DUF1800 domain-containing protein [Elusimicrobiota bacterium]|nr:DUF1800 domain-containing protein [Elusimicrobiota bacterium]